MTFPPLLCAEMAAAVYEWAGFVAFARGRGFLPPIVKFDNLNDQAAACVRDKAVLVVARGTEASRGVLDDIRQNFKTRPVRLGEGSVHRGYFDGAWALWPQIANHLAHLALPVTLTGHSMGGAIATVLAGLLQAEARHMQSGGPPVATQLVTFGSPMVGDAELVAWLKVPHSRYVNGHDAATLWPPVSAVRYGYCHHGARIRVDDGRWGFDHPAGRYVAALRREAGP